MFQEQTPSCVLVGVLTRERVSVACFRSKLPRVHWLGFLPGSVLQERVSGASSLVCTSLKSNEGQSSYLSGCEVCELVLLWVSKPKMTAAVPLGVSKVIGLKKND